MSIFKGSGVALITPFTKDDSVNFEKLGELLEYHIKNKTDAIIINGTTGESATLTDEEKYEIIKYSVKRVNGRVPVIAGTGSNNTKHAVELSKKAEALGVDGLLVVTPYYNKGNENGIYEHYKLIAENVNCPIILYNVPSRTGVNLSISLLKKLAEIKNIVAIKEASGNISYAGEIAREVPELDIYSGNDDMTIPLMSYGGIGVISVSANIIPETVHNMCMSFLENNIVEAKNLQLKYNDLVDSLFIEVNPVPIKEAMNYLGYNVGHCRLPLGEMKEENKIKLHSVIDSHEVKSWS
ncbi:4-hydroxy-tetrahydrodipicolinate synthase [Fusobacterium mortiferum]|uniref:4-hydroxy-tetrahydrodipicolinate synthase n=1 Tax=Fusobacterium mortiferum TaxID=850 RepID=UPI001F3061D3|nr:4-hydroxy-tetrahydrodipicolinate synthase [Fusobacterium mortiferum]MCF2626690.1 4-hydroxy-tetrahydrodipicolinate synthase [Fusobacterium mortiferum]